MAHKQSAKRVDAIKAQVDRDKEELKQLLELRRKYQLSALSRDPLLSSSGSKVSQASLSLEKLFVITLDYQNPKIAFPQGEHISLIKEAEALSAHSLMLEVSLMKKVIVHAHNKQDGSFLSLHFHPRLKHMA